MSFIIKGAVPHCPSFWSLTGPTLASVNKWNIYCSKFSEELCFERLKRHFVKSHKPAIKADIARVSVFRLVINWQLARKNIASNQCGNIFWKIADIQKHMEKSHCNLHCWNLLEIPSIDLANPWQSILSLWLQDGIKITTIVQDLWLILLLWFLIILLLISAFL